MSRALPPWWEPLRTRAAASVTSDFTHWTTPEKGRPGAVLVLLGEQPDTGPDLLVLERAATMRTHAGQPAFPGGAADPGDADPAATALREAYEEVGVDPDSVTVVAQLPELWIPVSGFVVTPVLAWWHAPHPVRPEAHDEVARVARVPIRELVDPDNRLRLRLPNGYIGPAFEVCDMLVWGFTGGVIATILELADWAVPWPRNRIVDLPEPRVRPVP